MAAEAPNAPFLEGAVNDDEIHPYHRIKHKLNNTVYIKWIIWLFDILVIGITLSLAPKSNKIIYQITNQ